MAVRIGEAKWEDSFKEGSGVMKAGHGPLEFPYSAGSRFENAVGSNPEELIGAAHAGCYSMALALDLNAAGYSADYIKTRSKVRIEKGENGYTITQIMLFSEAKVTGIQEAQFQSLAKITKDTCPVSRALNVPITLEATLLS